MNSVPIEELERQLEATRHSLDRTLRQLQFRLSPRQQAALAWQRVTTSPVPAVIVALGIAAALYLRTTRLQRRVR